MPHQLPRYRADHIGSLLRPRELYEMRQQLETRPCTSRELTAAEDEAVKQVLALQQEVGIKDITDGEMRRSCFFDGVFEKLGGMLYIPEHPISMFKPYIPHIAIMYDMGVKHSPTFFCNVSRSQQHLVSCDMSLKTSSSGKDYTDQAILSGRVQISQGSRV
ncbi:hypothetical protein BJ165DRAFT_306748 [Panaeolus papilionaceus]|nr:hypothetical protein BJ165DRAFT_306748 [Panaeolus papilionaceus]